MFIDDGWQRLSHGRGYQGCGDWLPDAAKFDDLAQTMKTIHSSGAAVALWVAPLLLGQQSVIFPSLYEFAPLGIHPQLPGAGPALPAGPKPRG